MNESIDDGGSFDDGPRTQGFERGLVSCQPLGGLFEEVTRRGLDPQALTTEVAHSVEFLADRRNRIHWDDFRRVIEALGDHYSDDEVIDVGRSIVHTQAQRPFGLIAKRFFSVADFYRAVYSANSGWGKPMFPCMDSTFAQLGDGVYEATLTLDDDFDFSRRFMLITEGNITGMPEVLGSRPAEVRTELSDRGARFEIRATDASPLLARVRRRLGLPFRAGQMAEELQSAHASLRTRYDALLDAATQQEQTAEALRDSETRLRLMLEHVEMWVWDWDLQHNVVTLDDVGQRVLGFDEPVISSALERFLEKVSADDREVVAAEVQDAIAGTRPYAQQFRVVREGEVRTMVSRGHVFRDHAGIPERFIGVGHDVTDELRRTERFGHLGQVVASSPIEISVVDADTLRILDANPVACRNLGYSEAELRALSVGDITDLEGDEATSTALERILEGETGRVFGLVRQRRKDGTTYPVELNVQRSTLDERPVLVGIGLDVTDRVRADQDRRDLENQLWQAQKLDALGTLASGITHDFNNVLMAITGYTELALGQLGDDAEAAEHLDRVLRAAEHGKSLARQVLTFSRAGEQPRQPTELGPVVLEAIELIRPSLPPALGVDLHVAQSGCIVHAEAGQIGQVVTNLITNAAHATDDPEGSIDVRLERCHLDDAAVQQFPGIEPGPHVRLSVTDRGSGMEPEVAAQIFDPFFTTKDMDVGTGLGLAVVHGIVLAHGGAVTVESERGEGTTMTVFLPCVDQPAAADSGGDVHSLNGNGRVLVVDDHDFVIDALGSGLERLGYEVSTMASSTEALAAFLGTPDAFDVVVTDQTMPELTGLELAERLHQARDDLAIVLISGLGAPPVAPEILERAGIDEVLTKPFGLDELGVAIGRALDRPEK